MKKLLFVLFVAYATFFGSCSEDKVAEITQSVTYQLSVRPSCIGFSNIKRFCVSQEEYDNVKTIDFNAESCKLITFKTTDNQQYSGYFMEVIKGCN